MDRHQCARLLHGHHLYRSRLQYWPNTCSNHCLHSPADALIAGKYNSEGFSPKATLPVMRYRNSNFPSWVRHLFLSHEGSWWRYNICYKQSYRAGVWIGSCSVCCIGLFLQISWFYGRHSALTSRIFPNGNKVNERLVKFFYILLHYIQGHMHLAYVE